MTSPRAALLTARGYDTIGQVVQRIEQAFPKRSIRVRFPSRPPIKSGKMKGTKQIIVEKEGKVIAVFASLKDAELLTKMNSSTIEYRLAKGGEVRGLTFRYCIPDEVESFEKISSPKKGKEKEIARDTFDMEEADKKFNVVDYKLSAGRICITPCPYREAPKPKVGSAACMECTSFHGRNRITQQVACSAVNGKVWKNRTKYKEDES